MEKFGFEGPRGGFKPGADLCPRSPGGPLAFNRRASEEAWGRGNSPELCGKQRAVGALSLGRPFEAVCVCVCVVSNSAALQTVACQGPLSMDFSRREYWTPTATLLGPAGSCFSNIVLRAPSQPTSPVHAAGEGAAGTGVEGSCGGGRPGAAGPWGPGSYVWVYVEGTWGATEGCRAVGGAQPALHFFICFLMATQLGTWDFSALTRDRTCAVCSGSSES